MVSSDAQNKAQALNEKLEAEARKVMDEIDRHHLRKLARNAFSCATRCYDTAGTTGSSEELEHCSQNCHIPYQQANSYVQNEVGQFQNRLNRAMQECQDKARDVMVPGYENDARKMAQIEKTLLSCMSQTVDQHIQLLKPMKQRILGTLQSLPKS